MVSLDSGPFYFTYYDQQLSSMTLNISVITQRYVCQVSDRRLVRFAPDSTVDFYTDHANKSTILQCQDAVVGIAYHGIGEFHPSKIRTDTWLVNALLESNASDNLLIKVLEDLAGQASIWLKDLRGSSVAIRSFSRHTFVVAGWSNLVTPQFFFVSNYEHTSISEESHHPWDEFKVSFARPKPGVENPWEVVIGGSHDALHQEDIELIKKVVPLPGAKPIDVINILVRALQRAAGSSKVISKSCMSIMMLPGASDIQCKYHTDQLKQEGYGPNFIGPSVSFRDIWFYRGSGIPSRKIRAAVPSHFETRKLLEVLSRLPNTYITGDELSISLDPDIKEFLDSLPAGIKVTEIIDAI